MALSIQLCNGACASMSVNSITPISGTGLSQKFTYVFKGATSIASGRLLLNTGPFENNAGCDVEFIQATQGLQHGLRPHPNRCGPNLGPAGQQFHYVQLKTTAGQTLPDSDCFIPTGS